MRIAAIQMTGTPDKTRNLNEAHRLLLEAVGLGSDLVAFPENFSLLTGDRSSFLNGAETSQGPTLTALKKWARDHSIWILGGSVPTKVGRNPSKVTNSSYLISNQGKVVLRYDKIHLFDVLVAGDQTYQESQLVLPGKKVAVANTPWTKVGLSVCYDLRFPELYRRQSALGAKLLFIPAAFTKTTGRAHWDVLTRARAIENLSYVVAPAQNGSPYPGRETFGHTRIIDPWGQIVSELVEGSGVVWANLDFSQLQKIRNEFPALQHRKLKV